MLHFWAFQIAKSTITICYFALVSSPNCKKHSKYMVFWICLSSQHHSEQTQQPQKCKIVYIYCAFCNSESSGAPAAEASKSKFATSSYCCVLFMFFYFVQLRELSPVYRGSLGAGASGWLAGWGGGGLMGPPHGPPKGGIKIKTKVKKQNKTQIRVNIQIKIKEREHKSN